MNPEITGDKVAIIERPQSSEGSLLRDGTDLHDLVDADFGRISRRIYGDPEIFELEMERIFRRAWLFIGHESEVPEPGDYVTRDLAGEPIIMVRDDDTEEIGAFLNSCRHRGMRVCRADKDNVAFMRCAYHGWTYATNGDLRAAFAEELYDEEHLKKEELGLIPVTKVASYHGMVFGTWDENAPDLEDYLGDMKFYLDLLVGRSPSGFRVVGAPQVWEVNTNWKFATDNFTGDNAHLPTTHGSMVELQMLPPDPMAFSYGTMIDTTKGHVLHMVPGPPNPDGYYFGLPPEQVDGLKATLSQAHQDIARDHFISVGTVFPNLSYLQVMVSSVMGGPPAPFLNWRMWVPTGPHSTKIYSWFFIENNASAEYLKDSYECYVRTFGPSGIYEQDDMENWEECTRVNVGKIAQQYDLHHGMNMHLEPNPDWKGPGIAYPTSYGEMTQVAYYANWLRWMTEDDPTSDKVQK